MKRLVASGADVVCLVRDWVPQSELVRSKDIEKVKVVRGDIRDHAILERTLGEFEIDTVFHLAAQTIVGIANRNPVSTFETNIEGTWEVLEAADAVRRLSRLWLLRQIRLTAISRNCPMMKVPLEGHHPYDVSKSCGGLIAHTYAKTYSLR